MSEVKVSEAMVDAALDAWWDGPSDSLPAGVLAAERRDMRSALTAALAVSAYGEVVEALTRVESLANQGRDDAIDNRGMEIELVEANQFEEIAVIARAALARATAEEQS